MGEKNQDAFREHDAYAKKGRERYPMLRNTDALLSRSSKGVQTDVNMSIHEADASGLI